MMPAQFFDIFGTLGFVYIIIFSLFNLCKKKHTPKWTFWVLFAIGIIGFAVDLMIVWVNYLR